MTKQWDMHEATIKQLYAENTLARVRQMMIDQYGFKASVRAYRGRLIRWGVRKYNCRKRASSDSSGSVHGSKFLGSPETTSPAMMINTMATSVPYNTGGHLAMPRQINQQPLYNPIDDRARMYNEPHSYDIKPKPILSPPQTHLSTGNGGNSNMNYTWEPTKPPLKRLSDSSDSTSSSNYDNNFSPPNHHSHSDNPHSGNSSSAEIMAPPTFFGNYGAPVPMTTTTTTAAAAAAAMGHTKHNSYSTEHMSGMDHNGSGNATGNANTGPYYSFSNAEYNRYQESKSGIRGYYDGAAHRNAPVPVGQVSDIPRGVGDGGWA
ncbi:hypothetical protein F4806DRAFT_493373 [Annulohypoxylon nitens]|nr:hypothetical protein F4806DRAFT_493373 [Annulohypoxylon nitens]